MERSTIFTGKFTKNDDSYHSYVKVYQRGSFINTMCVTGWWFGTMDFYDFPYIGNVMIPTD